MIRIPGAQNYGHMDTYTIHFNNQREFLSITVYLGGKPANKVSFDTIPIFFAEEKIIVDYQSHLIQEDCAINGGKNMQIWRDTVACHCLFCTNSLTLP